MWMYLAAQPLSVVGLRGQSRLGSMPDEGLRIRGNMYAMLCGGVRPLEHLLGLPKPLWTVVLCWPQCVDSCCTLEMTYFTRPSDGLQRHSRVGEE